MGVARSWALILTVVWASASLGATPLVRQETELTFGVDQDFQDRGGVQVFYRLLASSDAPATTELFSRFRPFDVNDRWNAISSPANVVMLRFVYTIDKDVSFFSEARAKDLDYINAVASEMNVSKNEDGSFHVGRMPSNDFWVSHFGSEQVKAAAAENAAVKQLLALDGETALPDSVVFQENKGFARILGHRTAEASVTWTAHYSLGPGRTRIGIFTMTYVCELPPFFLGGERRVRTESIRGALEVIDRLRAYGAKKSG